MRKISLFLTILITSFVMALAGLVASPIASASENGNGSISATFPLGSSVLTKSQKAAIKKALASSGSDVSFIVTGTAGKLPGVSDRSVQRLAKKRAQAIKAYLVSLGVSKTRITTQVKITAIGVRPKSTGSYPTSASTVAVTNSASTGSGGSSAPACTPVTAPGAPTSASATVGNTQSVVSWTAPTIDGGCAVTSYTVTANPGPRTCTAASPSTSCTVTSLTNGTAYTFTVTATNSAGTGSASTASSSVTPATTPGAPTSVSATVASTQSVVSWTAPASTGGSAITGYTVTANPGPRTCTAASPSTSCTVTSLSNGTAYTFTVTATNSAGTGSASTASSSITPTAPVYAVGDAGPGGGIVYYVDNVGFSCGSASPRTATCNYLEVAPRLWGVGGIDGDTTRPWAIVAKKAVDISIPNYGTAVLANISDGIGLGYSNSLAIVAEMGPYSASAPVNNYAAGAARAYTGGGQTDWYLPTTAELNLLCQWNRGVAQVVTTVCAGGSLNAVGGAASAFSSTTAYWTSSELSGTNAWGHNLSAPSQSNVGPDQKLFNYHVRPIRAF